jgi:hypothetical protein
MQLKDQNPDQAQHFFNPKLASCKAVLSTVKQEGEKCLR